MGRRKSGQAYEPAGRTGEAPGTSRRLTDGPGSTLDMGFLGSPTDFPGPPWTVWTAKELPEVSLGFPGFPDVPETSIGFIGPPGRPRGFPGPPWDVGMCQGSCSGLFEVSYAFPEVSQTGMTDRIPPVNAAAAVPAHQRHVLVSVHWFETFVAVPPPRWSIMVGSESGKLVCWSYFVRHIAVSARQATPEHSQTGTSERHGGE